MPGIGLNIPAGRKLIGNNLALNARHPWNAAGLPFAGRYELLWGAGWDWDGWIRPQLDYLMGDLGCNCIRSLGGHWAIMQGRLSLLEYTTHLVQIASYLKDHGAYFYLTGDSHRAAFSAGDGEVERPITDTGPVYVAYLSELEDIGNSIGFDFMNEADNSGSGGYFRGFYQRDLIAFVKNAGVTLPVTYSVNGPCLTSGNSFINANAVMNNWDYLDFHDYRYPYNLNFYTDKGWQMLIGETGINSAPTAPSNDKGGGPTFSTPRMLDVYKLALQTHPNIRGILHWAVGDQTNVGDPNGLPHEAFGVYNTNDTRGLDKFYGREDLIRIIKSYTRGSLKHTNSL